jgi:hypothetical protein
MERYQKTGKMMFELAEIERDDAKARFEQVLYMFN